MKFEAIVISGLPGAGKGVLAKKLGEQLGWKVFSIGDLWREKYKEAHPNDDISFEKFWRNVPTEEQQVMDQSAKKIIEEGKVVGEFRYAKLCEGLNCLFVFVTADLDVRAKRAMQLGKYKDRDLEGVKEILEMREGDEERIGKDIYGEDYDYKRLDFYNLVIDSGELSIDEEVEVIKGILEGMELKQVLKKLKL